VQDEGDKDSGANSEETIAASAAIASTPCATSSRPSATCSGRTLLQALSLFSVGGSSFAQAPYAPNPYAAAAPGGYDPNYAAYYQMQQQQQHGAPFGAPPAGYGGAGGYGGGSGGYGGGGSGVTSIHKRTININHPFDAVSELGLQGKRKQKLNKKKKKEKEERRKKKSLFAGDCTPSPHTKECSSGGPSCELSSASSMGAPPGGATAACLREVFGPTNSSKRCSAAPPCSKIHAPLERKDFHPADSGIQSASVGFG
jgi:hypothetical protein